MPSVLNEGVRIHYEVEGEGPSLVLHHGAGGSIEIWHELGYVEPLRSRCRLVMLDARGHGGSDKPHDAADYEMQRLVADVVAVMDDLGLERTHFLGYSLGGRVGFGLAKYAPERLRSLILGGIHPYRGDPPENNEEVELLKRGFESYVAAIEATGVVLPPEVKARLLASDAEALLAVTLAMQSDPGYEEILAGMELPCLMYVGERDLNYAGARECANHMPNVDFLVLPGLDHGQALRQSELVVPEVREFIDEVEVEAEAG